MSGPVVIYPVSTTVATSFAGASLIAGGALLAAFIAFELVQERKCRLKRLEAAASNYAATRKSAEEMQQAIKMSFIKDIADLELYAESKAAAENMREVQEKYYKLMDKVLEKALSPDPEDIDKLSQNIEEECSRLYKECLLELSSIATRSKEYLKELELVDAKDFGFANSFNTQNAELTADYDFSGVSQKIATIISNILSEAQNYINNDLVKPKEKDDIISIVSNVKELMGDKEKYTENMVESINAQYLLVKNSIQNRIDIFEALYADYITELLDFSSMTGIAPIIPPRNKFANVEELRTELENIREKAQSAMFNNYLMEQLDDVMQMFGYNVGERLVLNKNQKGNHILCPKDDDDSAIHLYVSEKDEIMIEIVGHEEYDGSAENALKNAKVIESKDLAAAERAEILEKQHTFCEVQREMIKELERRGILIGEMMENAADEKYCKKILTTKSETKTEKTQVTDTRTQARRPKEKLREIKG